jgi:hypothetical protein
MRCPSCGSEGAAGSYCSKCGGRLFAWVGDPLGANDAVGPARAAALVPTRGRPATSEGKLIFGLCVIALVFVASPIWSAVLLVGVLVVLWRWPGVGWLPWSLFLVGVLLVAVLWQTTVSWVLVGTPARLMPTAVATLPPAAVTATAVAREASDAYERGAELWRTGDSLAAIEAFTKAIDRRPDWSEAIRLIETLPEANAAA